MCIKPLVLKSQSQYMDVYSSPAGPCYPKGVQASQTSRLKCHPSYPVKKQTKKKGPLYCNL